MATKTLETESVVLRTVIPDKTASDETTAAFLKASGYKAVDILDSNEKSRTFVTKNGGKYRLSARGTKVIYLAGPDYPKQEPGEDVE